MFVGQDLAFSGNYVHANGTYDKREDEVSDDGTFLVEGKFEEKMRTKADFHTCLKWFEYYIEGCKEYEPVFNGGQRENNIKFLKGPPEEFREIAKGAV